MSLQYYLNEPRIVWRHTITIFYFWPLKFNRNVVCSFIIEWGHKLGLYNEMAGPLKELTRLLNFYMQLNFFIFINNINNISIHVGIYVDYQKWGPFNFFQLKVASQIIICQINLIFLDCKVMENLPNFLRFII